jgi:hypothetical protein
MKDETSRQRTIIEDYISAYNAFDVEGMLSFVHRDVEFKNISGGRITAITRGIDELRELAEQSTLLFTSRHQSITSFEEEGESVQAGIKFQAILAVDLPEGPGAGEELNIEGSSVFEFREGKLWKIFDYS